MNKLRCPIVELRQYTTLIAHLPSGTLSGASRRSRYVFVATGIVAM